MRQIILLVSGVLLSVCVFAGVQYDGGVKNNGVQYEWKNPVARSVTVNDSNFCTGANVLDAAANADTPATLAEIEKDARYEKLSDWQSVYHNFKSDFYPRNTKQLEEGKSGIFWEYFGTQPWNYVKSKSGLPFNPSEYTYLDAELPNVKFIEKDGHREAVYNRKTGQKVTTGINKGTANIGSDPVSMAHLSDIIAPAIKYLGSNDFRMPIFALFSCLADDQIIPRNQYIQLPEQ